MLISDDRGKNGAPSKTPMFIDTHCHIADAKFDLDREDALARAKAAGVRILVEIAESPQTWDAAIALADRYPHIYASLGIHPHHAHEVGPAQWPTVSKRLKELLQHPKVMAIGEFGLDYFRMQNTKEQQDFLFKNQLELAREMGKPIVIHCRDAHADTQKGLAVFYPDASYGAACPKPHGVIHCFTGSLEDAQMYLARGFYLGIDGPVTYPNSKQLQENVGAVSLDRLVLETDSPYLPPQSHRGQRNEPRHIPAVAAAIASLKKIGQEKVAETTTANAKALFRLPSLN